MAQRNTPSGKPGSRTPSGKPGARSSAGRSGPSVSTTKGAAAKGAAARGAAAKKGPARKVGAPPPRKPGKKPKSIVNQKQTPWGLIIATTAIVLFAAAIVIVVVVTHKSSTPGVDASDPYRQPELAAAKKIKGVTYKVEPNHTHVQKKVNYDATPPVGGDHSAFWADCSGTVYAKPIANENAVHMLEHGAIWITYNADKVKGAQLAELKKDVSGVDRMALSPYPDLKSSISLQAWGYQLKVDSASDPRIQQFISALKYNQKTTPEYGASCSNPQFKANPSTFGHPSFG